jgi:hypothetical protein
MCVDFTGSIRRRISYRKLQRSWRKSERICVGNFCQWGWKVTDYD